jgi:hypothetical protein
MGRGVQEKTVSLAFVKKRSDLSCTPLFVNLAAPNDSLFLQVMGVAELPYIAG